MMTEMGMLNEEMKGDRRGDAGDALLIPAEESGGALRHAAIAQGRSTLVKVLAVARALERVMTALGEEDHGDLRKSAEDLRDRRRAAEAAALDAQELTDRVLDSANGPTRPPIASSR
ncbi:MAG: hypothetical protein U0359_01610 [Byssovorax sp.]